MTAGRTVIYLPAGPKRRIFVDRKAVLKGTAPYIVEAAERTYHAHGVDIEQSRGVAESDGFMRVGGFVYDRNADAPPVIWFETWAAVRLEVDENVVG